MAQLNSKNREINLDLITKHNALVGGDKLNNQLYYQLKMSISKANRIDIIVSFVMESGIKMIIDELKQALDRGVEIRLLTGNYLNITQPAALYKIKHDLNNRVDLRLYDDQSRSFHPKAYIFHYDDMSEIFVGSSNISRSALTSGIEWNYKFDSLKDGEAYNDFYNQFEELFYNHSIILDDEKLNAYARNWHKPTFIRNIENQEIEKDIKIYEPRGAQNEALYALDNTREEGANKALVLAATGVGKTYLAAFDSRKYKSVLFVAHREEILRQAKISFENVRPNDKVVFFDGKNKETEGDVVIASVNTLGNDRYLKDEYFSSDCFDYIVIDEFHHAVNKQYELITNYFKPKFMLGLTATPDRMDGRNIYELCDYNVPFEISMREAINQGMLVPFRYYGIYDSTDYSNLKMIKGRYSENELTHLYKTSFNRNELIIKHYRKYNSKRALGFCCSRNHAEEMAKYFNDNGIPSAAVYSNAEGEYSLNRETAINKLVQNEIKVIFAVDMFNEGLDIPSLDMVMFLRPTESPIVFTQQLGRGLRTCQGKDHLCVLDFIGNYKKAGRITSLLRGRNDVGMSVVDPITTEYPDGCYVDFDLELIDLFEKMAEAEKTTKSMIHDEYIRIKDLLERVPSRVDLFEHMDDGIYEKNKICNNYLDYRLKNNDLNKDEHNLVGTVADEFLHLLETTSMTKVYKMAILSAFYNNGNIKMELKDSDVLKSWKAFFDEGINYRDFKEGISYEEYKNISDREHLSKAINMPIHFLIKSGEGFFKEKEGCLIALNEELKQYIDNPTFVKEFKDILDYRTYDYYRRRYRKKANATLVN